MSIDNRLELLDDSGKCPLCDTQWDTEKLRAHLAKRNEGAKEATDQIEIISTECSKLSKQYNEVIAFAKNIQSVAKQLDMKKNLQILTDWIVELEKIVLLFEVEAAVEGYPIPKKSSEDIAGFVAPSLIIEIATEILDEAKKRKKVSSQQTAWDALTRLEENLKMYETVKKDLVKYQSAVTRAGILLDLFEQARDKVLMSLYSTIRDRFVSLYRELHSSDEEGFTAKIEPSGAGLDLEVDFYGRGQHPPHAMHSEGHQDSMGLCLFLALCEYLTKGILDLIILDDVVMSVDSEHRKQLCALLKKQFPDRQFLITTHDRAWANQLRSESVIKSKRLIEFYNWSVDSGPQVNTQTDVWRRIDEDLKKDDVPSAAQKLRRGSEEYFREVCDAIEAKVIYRLNGKWELGDFLSPAMNTYLSLLAKAKDAANSWNKKEDKEKIQEWESIAKEIMQRTRSEGWAVNTSVHYDEWRQLEKQDFVPVVNAFKELFDVFRCSNPDCGSLLKLIQDSEKAPASFKCDCSGFNLNLVKNNRCNQVLSFN